MSCDDPCCFPRICEDNLCVFENNYDDKSHSSGYLSSTHVVGGGGVKRRGHVSYQNVVFGLGLDNQNIAFSKFRKSKNTVAGCLVLDRTPTHI